MGRRDGTQQDTGTTYKVAHSRTQGPPTRWHTAGHCHPLQDGTQQGTVTPGTRQDPLAASGRVPAPADPPGTVTPGARQGCGGWHCRPPSWGRAPSPCPGQRGDTGPPSAPSPPPHCGLGVPGDTRGPRLTLLLLQLLGSPCPAPGCYHDGGAQQGRPPPGWDRGAPLLVSPDGGQGSALRSPTPGGPAARGGGAD